MDLACIGHFNPKAITVRSKSRDLLSADSTSVPVPVLCTSTVLCLDYTVVDRRPRGGGPRGRAGGGAGSVTG